MPAFLAASVIPAADPLDAMSAPPWESMICPVMSSLVKNGDLVPSAGGLVTKEQVHRVYFLTAARGRPAPPATEVIEAMLRVGISEQTAMQTATANFDQLPPPRELNIFRMNTVGPDTSVRAKRSVRERQPDHSRSCKDCEHPSTVPAARALPTRTAAERPTDAAALRSPTVLPPCALMHRTRRARLNTSGTLASETAPSRTQFSSCSLRAAHATTPSPGAKSSSARGARDAARSLIVPGIIPPYPPTSAAA